MSACSSLKRIKKPKPRYGPSIPQLNMPTALKWSQFYFYSLGLRYVFLASIWFFRLDFRSGIFFLNASFPGRCLIIRKICPCNVYPLKHHFYIVKLGYAGLYLFFLFLLQNIDCGYSLEPPLRGGSNVYPQSMF